MNSSDSSLKEPAELCLRIRGCGIITSFKNNKMVLPAQGNRRTMLITKPELQKKMKAYQDALLSALYFAYQTSVRETRMECGPRSWIQSVLPEDDSWKNVPKGSYECIEVPEGQEGADIYITPLD